MEMKEGLASEEEDEYEEYPNGEDAPKGPEDTLLSTPTQVEDAEERALKAEVHRNSRQEVGRGRKELCPEVEEAGD